jgi:uncharacterized protein YyaL (SSP411 family)
VSWASIRISRFSALWLVPIALFVGCNKSGPLPRCKTNKLEGGKQMALQALEKPKNRLAEESSPYLLQHADNPVHWYPWGEEAFQRAKAEDKPVFLSIGYSTCHWCHVMAHESFEDPEVAALMNEAFVSVKVDREERPDIDNIYMTVCQMMTGGGGWPLTIVMTPDKEPFFAATYIPKHSRFGRKGMVHIVPALSDAWKSKQENIRRSASEIVSALAGIGDVRDSAALGREALDLAFNQLRSSFDPKNGGFGSGVKFPTPHQLSFLLRYHLRTGNPAALEMVEKTLTEMRRGGIYDHVGFGFHRYSTDPEWRVPHFEKMLYDQALLLVAYLEAYEVTRKPFYADTAREIAEYVLRDMTATDGGFFSAEDADSEGVEGKFYVWTQEELQSILGEESASLWRAHFDIRPEGNFEAEEGAEGTNVLIQKAEIEDDSDKSGFERSRAELFEARSKRVHPLKDDKVLADWNGLMMGALAKTGNVLGESRYIDAAQKNAAFIRQHLSDNKGRLLHRYRDGKAGLPAHLDDYAFVISGLLDLYEATFDPTYLMEARRLNALMLKHFSDPRGGALFLTADDTEKVIVRAKELYDGALPSGNSVAVINLLRLSRITRDSELEGAADKVAAAFGSEVKSRPITNTMFLTGLDFAIGPSVEVVIAGDRNSKDTEEMRRALNSVYFPNKVVLQRGEDTLEEVASIAPFVAHQSPRDGKATAYVCVNHACSFPTIDPKKMVEIIKGKLNGNSGTDR